MRTEERRGRFGSVMPLGREDFVREVTEGSRSRPDGEAEVNVEDGDEEEQNGGRDGTGGGLKGTGVVVFLFKDS